MTNSQRIRLAGTAYATGGALWFVLAGVQAMIWGVEPPAGSMPFYIVEAIFVIVQVLLLFGFFGILWNNGIGRGVFGRIAFVIGVIGHLIFVAGEVHSLIRGTLSDLVGLGALVSALGLLLTGIAVLGTKHWQGWTRWMPLLAGVYPWLVMFPFIFVSDEPNTFAIAGWGLLRLALGLAIHTQADGVPATSDSANVRLPQGGV